MKHNTTITPESLALKNRVIQVKEKFRLSLSGIADAAGMYYPTVSKQLKGQLNIDVRILLAVAKLCPDVSADWLLRGAGDMVSTPSGYRDDIEARLARLEQIIIEKQ